MLGLVLGNWRNIVAAALAVGMGIAGFWLGCKAGYGFGHSAGWKEGREALSIETTKALQEKNDAAAEADRALRGCLLDPDCLRSDDGWRIDRAD